ncbi:MAG: thrombospondin type 3 repeat-containing protein, partial [Syntrophobacteria bacterium]
MKRMCVAGVLAAVLMVFFSGCATLDRLLPDELQETKMAIEKARLRGADERCPEEYKQVVGMWYKARELYVACQSKEAFALAEAAREKARVLCTVTKDSDGDGVYDDVDVCPGTPKGVTVDEKGCPLDSDGDGVPDYQDRCPGTPAGVVVDSYGCPLDSDGDGVYD